MIKSIAGLFTEGTDVLSGLVSVFNKGYVTG
jgi:hypothetical protein